jgi:hypothetical protein
LLLGASCDIIVCHIVDQINLPSLMINPDGRDLGFLGCVVWDMVNG